MILVNRSTPADQSTSNSAAELGTRLVDVAAHEGFDDLDVLGVERLDLDHLGVDPACVEVEQVGHAPDMPAAKLRPVGPSTTTTPPVMYSHPWSPTPSTTALAPELRTQNRSPTTPRMNASPAVAPYSSTFPAMTLRCAGTRPSRAAAR